jgi:hypothetical protein
MRRRYRRAGHLAAVDLVGVNAYVKCNSDLLHISKELPPTKESIIVVAEGFVRAGVRRRMLHTLCADLERKLMIDRSDALAMICRVLHDAPEWFSLSSRRDWLRSGARR